VSGFSGLDGMPGSIPGFPGALMGVQIGLQISGWPKLWSGILERVDVGGNLGIYVLHNLHLSRLCLRVPMMWNVLRSGYSFLGCVGSDAEYGRIAQSRQAAGGSEYCQV
jgi:hypothetical protein